MNKELFTKSSKATQNVHFRSSQYANVLFSHFQFDNISPSTQTRRASRGARGKLQFSSIIFISDGSGG
jgi:hypothetical protein